MAFAHGLRPPYRCSVPFPLPSTHAKQCPSCPEHKKSYKYTSGLSELCSLHPVAKTITVTKTCEREGVSAYGSKLHSVILRNSRLEGTQGAGKITSTVKTVESEQHTLAFCLLACYSSGFLHSYTGPGPAHRMEIPITGWDLTPINNQDSLTYCLQANRLT